MENKSQLASNAVARKLADKLHAKKLSLIKLKEDIDKIESELEKYVSETGDLSLGSGKMKAFYKNNTSYTLDKKIAPEEKVAKQLQDLDPKFSVLKINKGEVTKERETNTELKRLLARNNVKITVTRSLQFKGVA